MTDQEMRFRVIEAQDKFVADQKVRMDRLIESGTMKYTFVVNGERFTKAERAISEVKSVIAELGIKSLKITCNNESICMDTLEQFARLERQEKAKNKHDFQ